MKVRDLISTLEDLAIPDAEVWFQDDSDAPIKIGGGYVDSYPKDGSRLVLTFLTQSKVGGF